MKIILATFLFAISAQSFAADLSFKVIRGDDATIPNGDFGNVTTKWLPDGSLEVHAWTTETPESSVIDSPASVDSSHPGFLYLTFREKHTPTSPDAPVVFCESVVELIFTVKNLPRTAYTVIVESASGYKPIRVEG